MAAENGVAAVERALSILDAFCETDDRLTLAELAKRTGLYKSTLLRLEKSLEKHGYVLRSEDGTFRLGSKPLYLGSLYQRHFRTSDVVMPVLRQVVQHCTRELRFMYATRTNGCACTGSRQYGRYATPSTKAIGCPSRQALPGTCCVHSPTNAVLR
jgi:DNA-binding IclR family transcriptional regulator